MKFYFTLGDPCIFHVLWRHVTWRHYPIVVKDDVIPIVHFQNGGLENILITFTGEKVHQNDQESEWMHVHPFHRRGKIKTMFCPSSCELGLHFRLTFSGWSWCIHKSDCSAFHKSGGKLWWWQFALLANCCRVFICYIQCNRGLVDLWKCKSIKTQKVQTFFVCLHCCNIMRVHLCNGRRNYVFHTYFAPPRFICRRPWTSHEELQT